MLLSYALSIKILLSISGLEKKKKRKIFKFLSKYTNERAHAHLYRKRQTEEKKPLNRQNVKQEHNICFPLDNIVFVEYCSSHQQIDVKCFQAHLFKH